MTSNLQIIPRKDRVVNRTVPRSDVLLGILERRVEYSNETYFDNPEINNLSFIPREVDFKTVNNMIDLVVDLEIQSATRRVMQTRRQEYEAKYFLYLGKKYLTYLGDQIFDMMRQVIFGARDRIKRILPYREHYQRNIDYQVGIQCGAIDQMLNKLNRTYYTAFKYLQETAFHLPLHYFLLMYQKHLAIYTDIADAMERAFQWEAKWTYFKEMSTAT